MHFFYYTSRSTKEVTGFLAKDSEKCLSQNPTVIWWTTIPSLRSFISKANVLKRARYSFNVSRFPYWKFTKAAKVFLGALLIMKHVQNASTSCLKLSIDWAGCVVNHRSPTFFKVVKIAWHIIGSRTLNKSINARNDSR